MSNRRKKNTRPSSSSAGSTAVLDRDEAVTDEASQKQTAETTESKKATAPRTSAKSRKRAKRQAEKGRDLTFAERLHLRFGSKGVSTLAFSINVGITLMVIFISYVMIWMTVGQMIPGIGGGMLSLAGGTSVSTSFEAMMAAWFAPLMFIVILLAVAEIWVLRRLWGMGVRARRGVRVWLGVEKNEEKDSSQTKQSVSSKKEKR